LEAAKITQTPVQLTGVQRVADHELRILRWRWSCWWCYVQSGRCGTDTSVRNFKEYWNLSFTSWLQQRWPCHSHPPRGKQHASQLLMYSWAASQH